jgi:hypothetical protein
MKVENFRAKGRRKQREQRERSSAWEIGKYKSVRIRACVRPRENDNHEDEELLLQNRTYKKALFPPTTLRDNGSAIIN